MWFPFVTVGSSNRVNTSDKQHVSTWPPTSPRRRLFSFLFGFRSLAFPISYSRYGGFLVSRCIYTFLGGKGEKTRAHLLWVTAHWSHEAARLLNCITPHVAFSLGKCSSSSSSSLLFFFLRSIPSNTFADGSYFLLATVHWSEYIYDWIKVALAAHKHPRGISIIIWVQKMLTVKQTNYLAV